MITKALTREDFNAVLERELASQKDNGFVATGVAIVSFGNDVKGNDGISVIIHGNMKSGQLLDASSTLMSAAFDD